MIVAAYSDDVRPGRRFRAASAAALGAYLRERGEIAPPASFEIVQGVEMGRPSRIMVSIVPGEAGVRVSGNAVAI